MRKIILLALLISVVACGGVYFKDGALIEQVQDIVSSGGSTQLLKSDESQIRVTGALAHTLKLPDATDLPIGRKYRFVNSSISSISIQDFDSNPIDVINPSISSQFVLVSNTSTAGVWAVAGGVGSGLDISAGNGQWCRLDGSNGPYTGNQNYGNFSISNIGSIEFDNATDVPVTVTAVPGISSLGGIRLSVPADTDVMEIYPGRPEINFNPSGTGVNVGRIRYQDTDRIRLAFDSTEFNSTANVPIRFSNRAVENVGSLELDDAVNPTATVSPSTLQGGYSGIKITTPNAGLIDVVGGTFQALRIGLNGVHKWDFNNAGRLQGLDDTSGGFEAIYQTSMGNATAGFLKLYPESDNRWRQKTDGGVVSTIAITSEVMLLNGTQPMTGNLNLGANSAKTTGGDIAVVNSLKGVVLQSPDLNCWRVQVDNAGSLGTTSVTCP